MDGRHEQDGPRRRWQYLRRKLWHAQKSDREKMSPWCAEVALVISCMMQYDFRIGVLWLRYPKRRGKQIAPHFNDPRLLHQELENQFLSADHNRLTSYVDPATCQLPTSVVKIASQFVMDFRLAEMVWRRNRDHGAVADEGDMVTYWNEIKDVELSGLATASIQVHNNATRCKLYRFRTRMDLKHGVVRYSDKDISLDEARMKAPFLVKF